jgi:hypothetical protein
MVPIMSVEGWDMAESQYWDMTMPDMTPWSKPKRRKPEEHTEVMAAMRRGPWRSGVPVLVAILGQVFVWT